MSKFIGLLCLTRPESHYLILRVPKKKVDGTLQRRSLNVGDSESEEYAVH